jgi:ankyrin repeat protein
MMACKNGHLDTAKKLYELGAKTDILTNDDQYCSMLAARNGHVAIREWLEFLESYD